MQNLVWANTHTHKIKINLRIRLLLKRKISPNQPDCKGVTEEADVLVPWMSHSFAAFPLGQSGRLSRGKHFAWQGGQGKHKHKNEKKGAAYIPLFQSSRGSVHCGSRDLGSGPKFSVVCSESVFTQLSPFIHNLSSTVPDTADATNTTKWLLPFWYLLGLW